MSAKPWWGILLATAAAAWPVLSNPRAVSPTPWCSLAIPRVNHRGFWRNEPEVAATTVTASADSKEVMPAHRAARWEHGSISARLRSPGWPWPTTCGQRRRQPLTGLTGLTGLNTICRWPHGGRRHGTWSAIRAAGGLT